MSDPIPLQSAYLCADCNNVVACSTQCLSCASTSLLSLARVMDRQERVHEPMRSLSAAVRELERVLEERE